MEPEEKADGVHLAPAGDGPANPLTNTPSDPVPDEGRQPKHRRKCSTQGWREQTLPAISCPAMMGGQTYTLCLGGRVKLSNPAPLVGRQAQRGARWQVGVAHGAAQASKRLPGKMRKAAG